MPILTRVYPTPTSFNAEIIRPETPQFLGQGFSESEVYRATLAFQTRVGVATKPVAEKRFLFDLEDPEQRCDQLLQIHSKLKQRKIPTLPFMYKTKTTPKGKWEKGEWMIIASDLTKNGRAHCISTNDINQSRSPYSVDRCNNDITLTNPAEIADQFALLLRRVIDTGIVLQADAFFLLIDKETGHGRVIVGDLGRVKFLDSDYIHSLAMQNRVMNMRQAAKEFMGAMNLYILSQGCELNDENLDSI